MNKPRSILACYAHPDDEILGSGATVAMYAEEGVAVSLVCATRGEAGEIADNLATPETLPQVREAELLCSAETLGISDVSFLDYRDSGMEGTADNNHPNAFMNMPAAEVVPQLVAIIRRKRPDVILTFEPHGGYGHPDHIAIHRHTLAAYAAAADPNYRLDLGQAWQTARLFYPIVPRFLFQEMKQRMIAHGLDVSFFDDFEERRQPGWPDDQIHLTLDVSAYAAVKWAAFLCHRTQFGQDSLFRRLPEDEMHALFQREYFALARPEPEPGLQLSGLFE